MTVTRASRLSENEVTVQGDKLSEGVPGDAFISSEKVQGLGESISGTRGSTLGGPTNASAEASSFKSTPTPAKTSNKSKKATSIDPRFYLTYQEEPHRSRRMEIIHAHPEVTKLVGHEPKTKYIVLFVCAVQFTCAYLLRNQPTMSWKVWLTAYFIGATCISNLFLAIHEFAHNLGFKDPLANKLFCIVTNLPVGIPYSASFGPYHLLHHKHMGEPEFDTDLPTPLEAIVLSNVAGKAFFATFQLFFYALRPVFLVQLKFTWIHFLNIIVQFAFDYLLVHTWGWAAYRYLIISAFLSGSLHPIAGHFIAEHYVFDGPKQEDKNTMAYYPETFSYYGWLNIFVYNAGYHNEHHDFPYIAWSNLKKLNRIASEFYDPLPRHTSWSWVIFDFVFDSRMSLWNRVKRPAHVVRVAQRASRDADKAPKHGPQDKDLTYRPISQRVSID